MVWRPPPPPRDAHNSTAKWTRSMLTSLADYISFQGRNFYWLTPITNVDELPPKREEGMLIYVGPNVLPGNQKGLYVWDGTQWLKI